ncbi:MAG TPA: RDD family protein [Chloroflexota bacterium]|nr:RDD family protein [Chloroflexota bacterium]
MSPNHAAPDLQGQYAGFVSRFLAFALDQLVVLAIILVANTTVILILNFFQVTFADVFTFSDDHSTLSQVLHILMVGLTLVINVTFYVGYFIFFWMLVGQTPGKMLMGVRVVSENGRPLSLAQAVKRLIGYYISLIPFFLGFFWILVSDTRQGWHDKIAHTYVIYTWRATPSMRLFRRIAHAAEKRAKLSN